MVLDEQDRELEVVPDPLDEGAELGDLLVVQPAGRLVEQQEPRLRDKRARELDPLLDPVRQRRRREVRAIARARRRRAPRAPPSRPPSGRGRALPTSTFSSTDIVVKSWMFWNVRAIPLRTILYAGWRRIDLPSNATSPESGL